MSLQLRNSPTTAIVPPVSVALPDANYFEQIDMMEDDCGATDDDNFDFLLKHDLAFQHFIYNEVIPAYEELKANPSSRVSSEEVRASLAALHAKGQ